MAVDDLSTSIFGEGQVPAPMGGAGEGVAPTEQELPPQEMQRRVNGWQQVFKRLETDPGAQMALLRFGTSMMRPVEPGNTGLGHFAQAMDIGATSLAMSRENEQRQLMANREQSRREQETLSQSTAREAQTRQTNVQTDALSMRLPLELDSLKTQISNAKTQGELLAVEHRIKGIEESIKRAYGPGEADAKIAQLRADAGYKAALSQYALAHARQANASADATQNNWQTTVTRDPEGNASDIISVNTKTGEKQVTRMSPPLPLAEATIKARQDINTVRGRVAGFFGGGEPEAQVALSITGDPNVKTLADAERVLTKRYQEGGVRTHRYDRTGKPLGTLADGDVPKPGAPTPAPPASGPFIAPQPVPESLKRYPVGTKVPNAQGQWFEITPQGMVPTAAPQQGGGQTPAAPQPDDSTKYTRKKVRGAWKYSFGGRSGRTMSEWAAVDAAGTNETEE